MATAEDGSSANYIKQYSILHTKHQTVKIENRTGNCIFFKTEPKIGSHILKNNTRLIDV